MPLQNSIRTSNGCIPLCILCISCCIVCFDVCHFLTFVFTGYYLEIEIRHSPNRWYVPCEYLLWLLGADPSEL